MKEIVIASPDQPVVFSRALADISGLTVTDATTVAETLEAAARPGVVLIIVDDHVDNKGGKHLILDILKVNAMISCAVISHMPEAEFHDVMEGLGILMQLPPAPGKTSAEELWTLFRQVNAYLFEGAD